MNSGIGDAHNLGWKIAQSIYSQSNTSLLSSYENERRPVVENNGNESLENYERFFDVFKSLGIPKDGPEKLAKFKASKLIKLLPTFLIEKLIAILQSVAKTKINSAIKSPKKNKKILSTIKEQIPHFDRIGLDLGYIYGGDAVHSKESGTPEASHILYGAGQLARRLGLPFRSGGGLCGSKLPDAQAAYETSNTLNAALMGGVNFMLHSCGWLEGGLVSSFEKFVMDADQLGVLHHLARGVQIDENSQALDAIREVGPGGHYLGCAHTQRNFKESFWRSEAFDYKPFETWEEEGAKDTMQLASTRVATLLNNYREPEMDIAVKQALEAFVVKRKSEMQDSFV